MIFVTVGNATQGFSRLLDAVEKLAVSGAFGSEEVFMQIGNNRSFHPKACQVAPFLTMEEFQSRMSSARLIVCHGGCTVFQALRLGKLPVVMPRMKRYGEHVNDHQVIFVKALTAEHRVVPAYEAGDLAEAVKEASVRTPLPWPEGQMQTLIGQAIRELLPK